MLTLTSSNMTMNFKNYQIDEDLMKQANSNAILNPCPPFYRGEELSNGVLNSKYFVGYEFKKNLLKVQQAIIIYCLAANEMGDGRWNYSDFIGSN